MSTCPNCRETFAPLDTVCPRCDVELIRDAPPMSAAAPAEAFHQTAGVADVSQSTTVLTGAPGWAPEPAAAEPYPQSAPVPPSGAAAPAIGGSVYHYRARSGDGQLLEGDIEAVSLQSARAVLRQQGLFVSSIERRGGTAGPPADPGGDSLFQAIYSGASLKARAYFFRQMALLIHSGIALTEALHLLAQQTSNKLLQSIALEAAARCTTGGKLSEALRQHPRVFQPVIIEMVAAGEESGHLDKFLGQIADYLEREYQVSSRIKGILVYPAFILVALIFLPNVPIWVNSGPAAYFGATLQWLFLLILGIGGFTALFRLLLANESFAMVYDQIKLATPVVGKVVRQFAMGKFGRTLGLLYSAGVGLASALEVAANACGNRYLRSQLLKTVPVVQAGGSLSDAVAQTGCFPPILMHMIATGEKTGNVDAMVSKIAEVAEADANQAVDEAVVLILPICVILLGVGVVFTAVRFYTGYFNGLFSAAGSG